MTAARQSNITATSVVLVQKQRRYPPNLESTRDMFSRKWPNLDLGGLLELHLVDRINHGGSKSGQWDV